MDTTDPIDRLTILERAQLLHDATLRRHGEMLDQHAEQMTLLRGLLSRPHVDQLRRGWAETDPEDIRLVEDAWKEAVAAIHSGEWDLVILDEINYAISYKMLDAEKVAEVLRAKPEMVHVILTGRNAHPTLVELADTVTEMREVKHAYQKGILAQRGIEF